MLTLENKRSYTINRLAQKAGISKPDELFPIHSGGNNRVWWFEADRRKYFVKNYFFSGKDGRDRLARELSFCLYAWKNGIKTISKPISADRMNLLAIFEFISGRRPVKEEIDKAFLKQVLLFLNQLNIHRETLRGQSLSYASDVCIGFNGHMTLVEKRLSRLLDIKVDDSISRHAEQFIRDEMICRWEKIKADVRKGLSEQTHGFEVDADQSELILSPSDFGFHNTILDESGTLFFIDFEYAGWDDPVKMICDFFSQPEIPVPMEYFDWFTKETNKIIGKKKCEERGIIWQAKLLLPLYRLKWCCLILNDFIPEDSERKSFASFNKDRRQVQLDKAVNYLKDKAYGLY